MEFTLVGNEILVLGVLVIWLGYFGVGLYGVFSVWEAELERVGHQDCRCIGFSLAVIVKVFRRIGIDNVSNLFLGSYHYSLDAWFVPRLRSSSRFTGFLLRV